MPNLFEKLMSNPDPAARGEIEELIESAGGPYSLYQKQGQASVMKKYPGVEGDTGGFAGALKPKVIVDNLLRLKRERGLFHPTYRRKVGEVLDAIYRHVPQKELSRVKDVKITSIKPMSVKDTTKGRLIHDPNEIELFPFDDTNPLASLYHELIHGRQFKANPEELYDMERLIGYGKMLDREAQKAYYQYLKDLSYMVPAEQADEILKGLERTQYLRRPIEKHARRGSRALQQSTREPALGRTPQDKFDAAFRFTKPATPFKRMEKNMAEAEGQEYLDFVLKDLGYE